MKELFSRANLLNALYLMGGLLITITVPLYKFGESYVTAITPAMIVYVASVIFALKYVCEKWNFREAKYYLASIAAGYILLVTIIGVYLYRPAIVYPAWVVAAFISWLILGLAAAEIRNLAFIRWSLYGLLFGGVLNAVAVIGDYFGWSLALWIEKLLAIDYPGPWFFLKYKGFFQRNGGVGLVSYSRTVTGYFLAIITIATFIIDRRVVRVLLQVVFFTGILYTGSRLGLLCWIIVMLFWSCRDGLRNNLEIFFLFLLYFFALYLLNLIDFNGLHGRLIGVTETYTQGVQDRYELQSQQFNMQPFGSTMGDRFAHSLASGGSLHSYFLRLIGSGAGVSAYAMGLDNAGHRLYEAHGYIFQYLADLGLIGTIFFVIIFYKIYLTLPKNAKTYGLLLVLVIPAFVDETLFPHPHSIFVPLYIAFSYMACVRQNITKS